MKKKKAQTQSMFLTGRQVACMVYEHVRIRDTDATVLDISETGLSDGCWSEAVERSCHLKDIQDSLADGRTPYVMRFHARLDDAVWPSGAATLRMPISQKDLDRLHQFREKILAGMFHRVRLAHGRWADKGLAHRRLGRFEKNVAEVHVKSSREAHIEICKGVFFFFSKKVQTDRSHKSDTSCVLYAFDHSSKKMRMRRLRRSRTPQTSQTRHMSYLRHLKLPNRNRSYG